MLTMHIFGILRLWGFQNIQFCSKLIRFCWLVTLYSFFYCTNSTFLLHKDFFSHHKYCSGWPLCIIKIFLRPKFGQKFWPFWPKIGFLQEIGSLTWKETGGHYSKTAWFYKMKVAKKLIFASSGARTWNFWQIFAIFAILVTK